MRVRRVERHENCIERKPVNAGFQHERIAMAGNADEAGDFFITRLLKRLERAVVRENLVHVLLRADIVHLPAVQMVGLQALERFIQFAHRAVVSAVGRFRGEINVLAPSLERLAIILLAATMPVIMGGVAIIDAEVEGAVDDRDGLVIVAGNFQQPLAAEAERGDLLAGLAERTLRHCGWRNNCVNGLGQRFYRVHGRSHADAGGTDGGLVDEFSAGDLGFHNV